MRRLFKKPVRLTSIQMLALKTAVHLLCGGYLVTFFWLAINDDLGADPVEALLHATGLSALNLLLVSLLVSPLVKLLPCPDLIRCRRLIGLYSFTFAAAHFATYALFELQLNWTLLGSELVKRPYITVGFAALLILLTMAVTSPKAIQRRLRQRWQQIHNWVYPCAALAVLHYTWSLKTLWGNPLIYWALFILLMTVRRDKLQRSWHRTVRPAMGKKHSTNS